VAGLALIVVCSFVAVALGGVGASAADDEPDLVPFLGAYALGCSWDNGCGGGHHGATTPALDFPMPEGVPIVAANAGVASLWEDSCAGRYIEIWHSGVRKYSRYLHLTSFAVREGDRVERGQIIGYSGNTGSDCSTGPHLHYDELDATRKRVDPGTMTGLGGGNWSSYPAALGVTAWNQMGAFWGPEIRNEHTVTVGTPTTYLGSTTTTTGPGTTVPVATTAPGTTQPPGPPPATTVPGTTVPPTPTTRPPGPVFTTPPVATALPEGTLFRAGDAPNVYVYAGGSPWWVPDPAQLDLLGGWGRVGVAGPSLDVLLSTMPWRPLEHRAFVEAGSGTLYWCAGGSPWPLSTVAELAALQAVTGGSGWSVLPGGAATAQWACGGTLPGTVFQRRGTTSFWVWTAAGWTTYADTTALLAAGHAVEGAHLLPAG